MNSKPGRAVATAGLVMAVGILWFVQGKLQRTVEAQQTQAPMFQVDPFWPRPLPNNWLLGSAIGLWVDDSDVIWMVHENLTGGEAGRVGPSVDRNPLRAPAFFVDHEGFVWVGGNGGGD